MVFKVSESRGAHTVVTSFTVGPSNRELFGICRQGGMDIWLNRLEAEDLVKSLTQALAPVDYSE